MFTSSTYTATDPDEYAAAIRGQSVELVSANLDKFEGSVTWVRLDRSQMERGGENRGVLARTTSSPGRVTFGFLKPTSSDIIRNATTVSPHELAVIGPDQHSSLRSQEGCEWATMSLAVDDFTTSYRTLLGADLEVSNEIRFVRPLQQLMARLQAIHEAIVVVAKATPAIIARAEATLAVEHALVGAVIASVADRSHQRLDKNPHHTRILARFQETLAQNSDRPMYMAEICSSIGVAGRTLRAVCSDYLGMSPQRYLHQRRLHLARRALLSATCATTNVTDIATQFGFWELGRFAVAYRCAFGESPSATLRAPAGRYLHQDGQAPPGIAKSA
jgi:AraC-like DNA-binding protein